MSAGGNRLSVEEIQRRIDQIHHGNVTLDVATYELTTKRARFIDCEYGEWWTQVNNVLNGHGHQKRGLVQSRNTCLKRYGVEHIWCADVVKQRIKVTNIQRYGVPHALQNPTILSKNMRSRRQSSVIKHWKTGVELICVARYEVAFVNWCNFHKIDFDWQIAHPMPDGRIYIIDAFIKDGDFANIWIEIKGRLYGPTKNKWEWFHSEHPVDSELWNKQRLNELQILVGKEPNARFM